ncbi:unnamed protein product [Angiostrongylus costaricensis]|uniref:Fatty acyl-CoA reductase n=1 Tax=Angiostrongylus costaricensis TaxID=334426 RepID=A0A0R3PMN5_ANGCS|nr:unnamed protein product [Angiostrongylus costaricensis]
MGLADVEAAGIFEAEVRTDAVREVVTRNVAHLIHFATRDASYMAEMNRLQQNLKCCGMKTDVRLGNGLNFSALFCYVFPFVFFSYVFFVTDIKRNVVKKFAVRRNWKVVLIALGTRLNVDHPWNMWFAAYSLDDTYPNAIRELYSLPWSCCNLTRHSKCEHIGVSRYLRTFDTPTDFNDVEKALDVNRLKWNPTTFDHYLERNEMAIATLYNSDCVVELLQRVITQVEITKTRLQRAGCSLTTYGKNFILLFYGETFAELSLLNKQRFRRDA